MNFLLLYKLKIINWRVKTKMYKRIIIFFIGLFSLLSTSTLTFASKINYNNSTPKLDRINFNNLTIKD